MNYFLKIMERNLTEEDKMFLNSIYEPQVVSVPPCDGGNSMCITEEGEIRIYGSINKKEPDDMGTLVYISSNDCGLSWKMHFAEAGVLGAAPLNPQTGRHIVPYPLWYRPDLNKAVNKPGTWVIINDEGVDSKNHKFVKLSEKTVRTGKPAYYIESCKRWIIAGEYRFPDLSNKVIVIFYSDDDGETWNEKVLEKSAPKFEIKPPHKGYRWQEYSCEPTIAELSNGELVMLVRTSQDYHYMYRSKDMGETWEGPVQSNFHGTITMPVLEKLSDGRIVFFWCNTQPMPELDHTKAFPPLTPDVIDGIWEDVFTNRDANHLAISEDDMSSWIGFRELFLNTIRNNADFRSIGGVDSRDKSIHQAQILELPYHKLLVHFGQNTISRKVVILDINWLYEKERFENFRFGLGNVSTQMYVKSNLAGYQGFSGHCAYNRTNGALLIPDPSGNFKEVLQICRIENEQLVYKKQGVVWNFPASKKGRVEVELSVLGSGISVSLTDHWYNPVDETVADEAHINIKIEDKCDWMTLAVEYETESGMANIFLGEKQYQVKICKNAPNGLSYLHLQTLAEALDTDGTIIRSLKKTIQ